MAFIYGGWSNSIRIEIPAVLSSNSSSSRSSSSRSSSSRSSLSSNSSNDSSTSAAPQSFSDIIFPLPKFQGAAINIPGA
jgi:hypothetical protein